MSKSGYRRQRLWPIVLLALVFFPVFSSAIPAFARKYQLRCTACHEAWPELNDFGRAFRDNGYQLLLGRDQPTTTPVGYWPVAFRLVPAYAYTRVTNQPTDQGLQTISTGGGFSVGAFDVLSAGTLGRNMSFLFVPAFDDHEWEVESAWVRFDNLNHSSWLNFKLGHHEVDLPRSAHRPLDQGSEGFLIYGYHPLGSESGYNMGDNQDGIEWVGHDRGSRNRVAVSVFNVDGSPGSKGAYSTPGVYFHATHEWVMDSVGLSAARLGVFGADASWPTTFLTDGGEPIEGTGSHLEHSRRYGIEGHLWWGPIVTPLHVILVYGRGTDSRELIPDATHDGTYDGGYLEVAYTPQIKTTAYFRYDVIRNGTQPFDDVPSDANDQTQYTIGVRHTLSFSTRAEYALQGEYSSIKTKGAAAGDPSVTASTLFFGVDFAF
jgi:hypothetical protein